MEIDEVPTIERLENEKRRINDEIAIYPTPIAGCDAQFNFLLDAQKRIAVELARIKGTNKR